MRARDVLVFPTAVAITCGGLLWGGHASYVALRNLAPTVITCADFVRDPPQARWVRLIQCMPDVESYGRDTLRTRSADGAEHEETVALLTPLRPEGTSSDHQAKLVVQDRSAAMLSLSQQPQSDVVDVQWMATYGAVDGMILDWTQLNAKRRDELSRLGLRLAEGFAVLARDARPEPLWKALGALGFGLGALGYLRLRYRRWKRRQPVPPPRATVIAG